LGADNFFNRSLLCELGFFVRHLRSSVNNLVRLRLTADLEAPPQSSTKGTQLQNRHRLPHLLIYYKTFGALNVKEHALPNSIIGVDDYDSSMKDLVAYLQKVAANKRRCTKPIMLGANNLFRNRFIENTILHLRIPLLSTLSMGACHKTQTRMGSRATTTCAYKN
jgi:hypothetical protein